MTKQSVSLLVLLLNTLPSAGGIFINGQWQEIQPTTRPETFQIAFNSINQLSRARDCINAWQAIEDIRKEKPVYPEKVFARLAEARDTKRPVTLFVPWGISPEWATKDLDVNLASPEATVLQRIKDFQELLADNRIKSEVLLMPADLYATEVNNYDEAVATGYMEWLRYLTSRFGYEMKPWSSIRWDNQAEYNRLREETTLDSIEANIDLNACLGKAYITAKKRSGYSAIEAQQEAGFAYIRERLCEAAIVERMYKPIKVSCVEPGKDGPLDGELPRLYLIPNGLRFPWLKGEMK